MEIAARTVNAMQINGVDAELFSAEDVRRVAPIYNFSPTARFPVYGGVWQPSAGVARHDAVAWGYARAAERLGTTMLPHTLVTEIRLCGDTVVAVETEHGVIRCESVVDAAGAWLRAVAALTGARVPVVPTLHQLMITEAIEGVDPAQPITRIIDTNVYVRPDEGGLMLGGYEPDPVQYNAARLPTRFDIAALELDFGVLRRLADSVREQLPVFQRVPGEIGVRVHRGGLPTMTSDGEHTLGPVPGVQGLYVAGGCCVGGLSISPAIGEALAAWIIDGEPGSVPAPWPLDRGEPLWGADGWGAWASGTST